MSRCRFLGAYDDPTRSADRIGLSAVIDQQENAFRAVATALGETGDALSGAAALDLLRPHRAAAMYRTALEKISCDTNCR